MQDAEKKAAEALAKQINTGEALRLYTKELREKHNNVVKGHLNLLDKEFKLFYQEKKISSFFMQYYPEIIKFYVDQTNKGWDNYQYSMEIVDYGKTIYKSRELPGFFVNVNTKLKNNKLGEYKDICISLAIIHDKEFSYFRNPKYYECGKDIKELKWSKVNSFKTLWNPTAEDMN